MNRKEKLTPASKAGEWLASITFAVVAATFVHSYFFQPYVIPTGSLERTLRLGDFLFVSKFHYGARVPSTMLSAPMVHDTLPKIGSRSYVADLDPATAETALINKLQYPYLHVCLALSHQKKMTLWYLAGQQIPYVNSIVRKKLV